MPSVESCENPPSTMSTEQCDKALCVVNSSEEVETMISVKVYDNLIAELRCPSCARPMEAPIKLCETGHSVCNWCTKMLARCPLCSKSFTETRSLTLEALSAKAQFRCSNSGLGCPVRLQLNLLQKHEDRCAYQLGDCFMGKVWGNCKWHGREIDWIDHCELDHREKVFFGAEVTRAWEIKRDISSKPLCAYYIFRVFGETFNFYQIYDKPKNKLCWTMVCASKDPNVAKRYSFEIELFSPLDDNKISVQRNPCHADRDAGILREGQCAVFGVGEIMRFMDENRILHYRIKVIENLYSKRSSLMRISPVDARNRFFGTDFTQTNIEGSNCKQIPSEKIITRRSTSSSNNSSLKGSQVATPKGSSSPTIRESPNNMLKNNSNSKESLKISSKNGHNAKESPKGTAKKSPSPIASLKRILSVSPTSVFKPIKFGSRKNVSLTSPTEANSLKQVTSWEKIIKTDSIDQTIIENNDLKKIFVRSYNIDLKNIDDYLDKAEEDRSEDRSTISLNRVNSIPKPPRISLDVEKENTYELEALLRENNNAESPPLPDSPIPQLNGNSRLITNDIK